ncbi:50S ribosomal protein L18 [Rhodohalobacter mucosus]|uniref:Large ribosomal subunit protein uL18 n=1 Tax=Rhodohalobacter mucosus TaxID=2079485 RepID=A0A316TPV4_9BACT|nr:50S ribosomal protein L18 [Rhodohalobacter mucosus]PWN05055.1 50S ribosomal protein L18 [Rhodohalobacter mucosus]
MRKNRVKTERRNKIRKRIRSTIRGTAERPRLSIFKSNKHIYLQLINDRENLTLMSASTKSTDLQKDLEGKSGVEAAKVVGEALAKAATDQGINKVVFDRSGYKYHGIVKAAADSAREGGLDF